MSSIESSTIFAEINAIHENFYKRVSKGEEIEPEEIDSFIDTVLENSLKLTNTEDREEVRSFLSFWSMYLAITYDISIFDIDINIDTKERYPKEITLRR